MSKTWKWILGIILGLVVLAGIGFVAASYFGFGHMSFFGGQAYSGHPMMNGYGYGNRGPMEGFRGFRQPMMRGRGFGGFGLIGLPFLFLGGLLRLAIPLVLLALVAFVFYQWGRRNGMNAAVVASRPAPAPAPETTTEQPEDDVSKN